MTAQQKDHNSSKGRRSIIDREFYFRNDQYEKIGFHFWKIENIKLPRTSSLPFKLNPVLIGIKIECLEPE
jgi:hypothetical protein